MPPYCRWFDANASCNYHYGAKGHSIENCLALKRKVQDLMKAGYVSFDYNATGGPNVTNNPLPNHPGPKINALTEDSTRSIKTQVSNVKTPMKSVYKALVLAKILQPEEGRIMKEGEQNETMCDHYCHYPDDLAEHAI